MLRVVRDHGPMRRIAAATTIVLLSFIAPVAAEASTPPTDATGDEPVTPTATAAVTTVRIILVDPARPTAMDDIDLAASRTLAVTIYLPIGTEPAPLIVLSHGFDGHPDKFTDLASAWAAAGYVVAVPRFPLSADDAPQRGFDIAGQAGDVTFVIEQLLSGAVGAVDGRIDPDRIGLFGLSLGSLSTWTAVLGDGFGVDGLDALIQSDGGLPFGPERYADVTFPVMIATSDTDALFHYDDVRAEYEALPGPVVLLTLHGALHATVGENTPTPADEAYRVATTVFWDRHLGGRADEPFPESVEVDGVTTLEER